MKKMVILLFLPLFLLGCGAKADAPTFRVVTGVEVRYEREDGILIRTYEKPASIQSILTFLRILQPFGPVIPDTPQDSSCRITLHHSAGEDTVYLLRGQRYLQKNNGDWENVNAYRASLLYPLLLLLPSDG